MTKSRLICSSILTTGLLALSLCLAIGDGASTDAPAQTAQTTEPSRAAIEVAYDGMNSAFAGGHIDRMADYMATDYYETNPDGTVLTREASLKKLQGMRSQIRTFESKYSIVSISSQPTGELVEMKMHCIGTGQKRIAFFKVNGTFTNDLVARDLWIDTPSGWRIKSRLKIVDQTETRPA